MSEKLQERLDLLKQQRDDLHRQIELSRLRAAIVLLANCMGAHIVSQRDADRLVELLAPPRERKNE